MNSIASLVYATFVALLLSGCTVRGVDTKLTPQIYSDGRVIYIYSDLANFAQPDTDPDAEKNRLRDLHDWVMDAAICESGYEIIKRQAISYGSGSKGKRIYYFIKCK